MGHEDNKFKNFAFISYSHKDIKQAKRLDDFLLEFRLPTSVKQKYPDCRDTFKDIFRDNTGMGATTDLSQEIKRQLNQSEYLIVVCSPNAVISDWVNKEIEYFKSIRGLKYIYPFVVNGIVNAKASNEVKECMPKALRPYEGRAANISTYNFEHAVIEIIADILHIEVDDIWQRHLKLEEAKKQKLIMQNNRLLIMQSRAVADKSQLLSNRADSYTAALLALHVLPSKIDKPNRPFVVEAEAALRTATQYNSILLKGHIGKVNSSSFSNDFAYIVSASSDKTVKIWDALTGLCIKTLTGHENDVNSAGFNSDNKLIVSASDDCTIKVWDWTSETCIHTLYGHTKKVYSAQFSPDGEYISSVSYDGTLRLWKVNTEECIRVIDLCKKGLIFRATIGSNNELVVSQAKDDKVVSWGLDDKSKQIIKNINRDCVSSAICADGTLVVSSNGKNIQIWNFKTGDCLRTIDGIEKEIWTIKISSDKKYAITMSCDYSISVWDIETGECTRTIKGVKRGPTLKEDNIQWWDENNNSWISAIINQRNWAYSCAFSHDGKFVITPAYDKTIKIWNIHTGECIRIINAGICQCPNTASFSNNGRYIVSGASEVIKLWDYNSSECLTFDGIPGDVYSVNFSKNDEMIVSTSSDNTIRLWDAKTGKCLKSFEGGSDGVHLASFGKDSILYSLDDFTIKIQSVGILRCLKILQGHLDTVCCTSYSPNGNLIVSASGDKTLCVWNANTGECIKQLKGHTTRVIRAYFIDDNQILSLAEYKSIKIWDVSTGKCIKSLIAEKEEIKHMAVSPSGKMLVIPDGKSSINILDLKTKKCVKTFEGHTKSVYFVSFSPDGRFLLSCSYDKTIRMWNVRTGKCKIIEGIIEGHSDTVHSALFSMDGSKIVSASSDKTIKIWDAKSGICLETIEGHSAGVLYASFNPNGDRIVSASLDKTVKIWDFQPLQNLIDSTRERFKDRQLTKEERKKYYLE